MHAEVRRKERLGRSGVIVRSKSDDVGGGGGGRRGERGFQGVESAAYGD
jgi:hypothetical protein